MKCPKCHYLSFEPAPRCRNCGFDLAMAESDLAITLADDQAAAPAPPADVEFRPRRRAAARRAPKTIGLVHPARSVARSEATRPEREPALALSTPQAVALLEPEILHDRFREAASVAFDDVPLRLEPEPLPSPPPPPSPPEPPRREAVRPPNTPGELPLFVKGMPAQSASAVDLDEIALAALSRPPRPPLAVRRTIPELVRPRPASVTPPRKLGPIDHDFMEDLNRVEAEEGVRARAAAKAQARVEREATGEASSQSRLASLGADWGMLAAISGLILWSSLRVAGVGVAALGAAALVPLVAFLAMVAFSYFLLFTAASGQTPGKMLFHIRVVDGTSAPTRVQPPSLAQAAYRALLAAASGLFLGAGFLPALGGRRLALHDRISRTRTVRA